ncbi:hypothetical protein HSBAA_13700 [Vreelandella sulfidaeris]|uniref:Uncharacterized protein n=1 Tax=Vreelandella sulfidaeris TaxID=115553 RepID=A0A455U9R7_9GAMM|nr:hypothetical protein HSBAA_13700 [Halomonas sulfidaeris]
MPLSAGKLLAIFKPTAKLGLVAAGHASNKVIRHAVTRRLLPTLLIVKGVGIANAQIFTDLQLVAHEVLKNDACTLT